MVLDLFENGPAESANVFYDAHAHGLCPFPLHETCPPCPIPAPT